MFKPFSLYIGLRYTKAKKRTGFVSFISLMSMIGIALGVMVLITVLSVMNGFDTQIREKLFTMVPHITITTANNNTQDNNSSNEKVEQESKTQSTAITTTNNTNGTTVATTNNSNTNKSEDSGLVGLAGGCCFSFNSHL